MKKTIIYTFFQLFFTVCTAQMQGSVTINVLDAVTREPIVSALVMLGDSHTNEPALLTDTSGRCIIDSHLIDKVENITVRCIGYDTWTGTLSDLSRHPNLLLTPTDNNLNTVVVSATMKEVSKDASPIPVDIYTPKFFQKNATPTIFEALNAVNGVRPQVNCNVCNTGDIQINGMSGTYTMVTIDGMPIVSGLSTVYGLSGIPNSLIERLEVVKGPASTLYGSEAVGGMINIITKNVLTAPRISFDAFGTSLGEYNIDGAISVPMGNVRTLLGVNYFNFNNRLDTNNDNFTDVTLQNRVSIFNKWSIKRRDNRVASIAIRYINENRWGGELNWTPIWRGTDSIYGESIYTERYEVLGKYQLPVEKRRVMVDFSWNQHYQNAYYGQMSYLGKQQVTFTQLTSDVPMGKNHDALLGFALRYTWYDDNTPATELNNQNLPSKIVLPGIFFQDDIELNKQNCLLVGLRYDYNSTHGSIITPRLSWKWSNENQRILRLTAGSGYRVANIFTEDHAALTGAREVVIEENLAPERSWNMNLNYAQKFFPKNTGFIGLDASIFFTYFSNQILPDYHTDPNKIIYRNLSGHAVSSGTAVNIDCNFPNGLKIITGVTAMNVYRVENKHRQPQLFAPPLSGTWTLTYPIKKWGLTIDYTGNMNSPMYLPTLPDDYRPEKSPWFSLHHLQLTQQLPHQMSLYIGVKNLFDFYPKEDIIMRPFDPFDKNIAVNNPNGYTFDPTYNYAPMQRRRFLVGLRWALR